MGVFYIKYGDMQLVTVPETSYPETFELYTEIRIQVATLLTL